MASWAAVSDLTHDLFDYSRDYLKGVGSAIRNTPRTMRSAYNQAAYAARSVTYAPSKSRAIRAYRNFMNHGGDVDFASIEPNDPDMQNALDAIADSVDYHNGTMRFKYDLWGDGRFPHKEGMFLDNREDLIHLKNAYKQVRDYVREVPLTEENAPAIGMILQAYDRINDATRYLDRKRDTPRYRKKLRNYGYRNLGRYMDVTHPEETEFNPNDLVSNPPANSPWANPPHGQNIIPLIYEHRGWPPELQQPQQLDVNQVLLTALAASMAILNSYNQQHAQQAPHGPVPGVH